MCRYCRQFDPFSPQARWGDDGARRVRRWLPRQVAARVIHGVNHKGDGEGYAKRPRTDQAANAEARVVG
jgi:hypothetical protein